MKSIPAFLIILLAHSLAAEIDGKLFSEYRNDRHVPCLYPLMSPDGTHLTRRFPFIKGIEGEQPDHPHHIGFWFAHGSVNGHGGKGESIVTSKLRTEGVKKLPAGSSVRFIADLEWLAGDKKVLTEDRIYTIT